ncbi:TRAP transporter small permease [Paracoccaceae bacterium GXU_MW_L88]
MRSALDTLYRVAGALAALLLVLICALITAQVVLNTLSKLGIVNLTIPSYADFSGFMLSASTFLALAYTLRHGGHIRVTLVEQRLPSAVQRWTRAIAAAAGVFVAGGATVFAARLCWQSYDFGDKSSGMIPVQIWIPQAAMILGLAIFTLALIDELLHVLRTGHFSFEKEEDGRDV